MTLRLTQSEQNALSMRLIDGLSNTVFSATYLSSSDFRWADELLSEIPEDAREKLQNHLGEFGLSRFIFTEINSIRLQKDDTKKIAKGMSLSDLPSLAKIPIIARALTEKLKSLPIRYQVSVALPRRFSHPIEPYSLPKVDLPAGVTIQRGCDMPEQFPTSSPNKHVDQWLFNDFLEKNDEPRDIIPERFYFSLPMLGYAAHSHSSTLGRAFEDNLKAFFGAGIAVGLLSHGWEYRSQEPRLPYIIIHAGDYSEIVGTEKLEDELVDQWNTSTVNFVGKNTFDVAERYIRILDKIGVIFHDNIDCRRLFTACIWFYRSVVNRRPLDALLEATIAIEVMLGDRKASEGIGLTNLLGSRCSFLLGRSSDHRQNIMSQFRKIYDLRSKIVHEGRHVMSVGDQAVVSLARSVCAQVINRELVIRVPDSKDA